MWVTVAIDGQQFEQRLDGNGTGRMRFESSCGDKVSVDVVSETLPGGAQLTRLDLEHRAENHVECEQSEHVFLPSGAARPASSPAPQFVGAEMLGGLEPFYVGRDPIGQELRLYFAPASAERTEQRCAMLVLARDAKFEIVGRLGDLPYGHSPTFECQALPSGDLAVRSSSDLQSTQSFEFELVIPLGELSESLPAEAFSSALQTRDGRIQLRVDSRPR